jgi:hypothetical protein
LDHVNVFVSVLPGRIRLRHTLLRERSCHAELCNRLRALVDLESDPTIGSLLLRYDPADTAMEARIRAEVDAVLLAVRSRGQTQTQDPDAHSTASENAPLVRHHPRRIHARSRINRVAKIGALAGMAASLVALGVSRKLHAQIGVLAVAMTLTHAAMHWRRTLR